MYKKYSKRGGKEYGPYLYENKRVGDKVVTSYLGKKEESNSPTSKFVIASLVLIVLLISLVAFAAHKSSTGRASFEFNVLFKEGEPLNGDVKFHVKEGELIPKDSKVSFVLNGELKEYLLSEVIMEDPVSGKYYAEDANLNGDGEGYGVEGSNIIYPEIEFDLVVKDKYVDTPETEETTEESETSVEEIESDSGSNDVALGITGNVADETEFIVSGKVSKDDEFSYSLEEGQTAEIISGSVTVNGNEISDRAIDLKVEDGKAIVETEYYIDDRGFGEEYLGDYAMTVNFDLGDLNMSAQKGTLKASLIYGDLVLASSEKDVEVIEVVNASDVNVLGEIPNIKIQSGTSYSLDLSNYFNGSKEYSFEGDNIQAKIKDNNITFTPEAGFLGITKGKVISYAEEGEVAAESNEFEITVFSGELDVKTTRGKIRVGQPVKWVKNVSSDGVEQLAIQLPDQAENISVKELESDENAALDGSSPITGGVVAEIQFSKKSKFLTWLRNVFKPLTGRAITDISDNVEVVLSENSTDYSIEYYTEAPQASEVETENGKEITISGPDELEYTDVIAYSELDNTIPLEQASLIKIYWRNYDYTQEVEIKEVDEVEEEVTIDDNSTDSKVSTSDVTTYTDEDGNKYVKQEMPFDYYDEDSDGKIDYIEWVVPHLSNQTFEIIYITDGNHLDENRNIVENVYSSVKSKDGVFASIPEGHYLRVDFGKNLTTGKDITVYAKSSGSGSITVYQKGTDTVVGNIVGIGANGKYLTLLNIAGEEDVFDLKVNGATIEFDYVVDPNVAACGTITGPGEFTLTQNIVDTTTSPCLNIDPNSGSVVLDGNGFSINGGNNGIHAINITQNGGIGGGSLVVENIIIRNFTRGIYSNLPSSFSVTITNNSFMDIGNATYPGWGVRLEGSVSGYIGSNDYRGLVGNDDYPNSGGSGGAIYLGSAGGNTIFRNNITATEGSNDYGIYMEGGTNTINGNIIGNSNSTGIWVAGNNNIYNNSISSSNVAVFLSSGADSNTIVNNTLSGNQYAGLGLSTSHNNVIRNNVLNSNNVAGIYSDGGASSANLIANNTISSNVLDGIVIPSLLGTRILNNTISNNLRYGISKGSGHTSNISGNLLENNLVGIIISGTATRERVINNTIKNSGSDGIYLAVVGNSTFANNTLHNNFRSISINGAYNNTFTGDVLNGSRTNALYFADRSLNNSFNNLIITNTNSSGADFFTLVNGYADSTNIVNTTIAKYNISTSRINVENEHGKIRFNVAINQNGTNLTNDIYIINNTVFVNSTKTGLNKTANVTLNGLSTTMTNPKILRDGVQCATGACSNFTSLNAGTVTFNVSGWSNYSIGSVADATQLSACGVLNISGGQYTLLNNVSTSGTCFFINASNIVLNGNGYNVNGDDGPTDQGVHVLQTFSNITLRNLNISNFGNGIYFDNSDTGLATGNYLFSNGFGVYASNSLNVNVTSNTVLNNTDAGIGLDTGNTGLHVLNNSALFNNLGIYLFDSSSNTIINNTANNNSIGFSLFNNANGNVLSNNVANYNLYSGLELYTVSSNTITNNTANFNDIGIKLYLVANSNTLTNNIANSNNYGVYATQSSNNVINNLLLNNSAINAISLDQQVAVGSYNNQFNNVTISNTNSTGFDVNVIAGWTNGTIFSNTSIARYRFNITSEGINFKSGNGEVRFIRAINGTGNNLSSEIIISNNSAYINSSNSGLNKSANISLYGMPTSYTSPIVTKDGATCSDCYNFTSLNAGTVVFNVSSGGNYSIGEGADPTQLTACGVLNISGSTYTLLNNVSISGTCFQVQADNVVLNGNGYNVDGDNGFGDQNISGAEDLGVNISGRLNITIKNVNITHFDYAIYLSNTNNSILLNNFIASNLESGIGIDINSSNNLITNNTVISSVSSGILVSGSGNKITNNTASSNINGIYLGGNSNNTVTNNVANSNSNGISLSTSSNNTVNNNTVNSNTNDGIELLSSSQSNTVTSNIVNSNLHGIVLSSSSNNTVTSNTVNSNTIHGLYFSGGFDNLIINNTANSNNNGMFLRSNSHRNMFTSNTVNSNLHGVNLSQASNNTFKDQIINGSRKDAIFLSTLSLNNNFTNVSVTNTNISFFDIYIRINGGGNGTYLVNTSLARYNITSSLIAIANQHGEIKFLQGITELGSNLSSEIYIVNNTAVVNSSSVGLNSSANISLYGVPTSYTTPTVLKNGVSCGSECYNFTSLNAGTVSFNATGSGNYSVGEWDDTVPAIVYGNVTETNGSILGRNSVFVNVSVTDLNFANTTINLYNTTGLVNSSVSTNAVYSINITGLADGTYKFNATAIDTFGNVNSTATRTVVVDRSAPLLAYSTGTENNNSIAEAGIYVNVSLTDANADKITFTLFNTSTIVNQTTLSAGTNYINFTGISDGNYIYNVSANDTLGNVNTTSPRTIRLISSCFVSNSCTEDSSCVITNNCLLHNDMCSGGTCNFVNLTVNNAIVYTLYNATGDGRSLNINISDNSSRSIIFIGSVPKIIFNGKNDSKGGHGGTLNITVSNFFNRTISVEGRGGQSSDSSYRGGDGGLFEFHHRARVGQYIRTRMGAGNSSNSSSGIALYTSPVEVRNNYCINNNRDADISNDGSIGVADVSLIGGLYNTESSEGDFNQTYDIRCDDKLNVIDISKVGFEEGTR